MQKYKARIKNDAMFEDCGIKGIEKMRGKAIYFQSIDGTWENATCKELKRNALSKEISTVIVGIIPIRE
jgi:hypothetical protein